MKREYPDRPLVGVGGVVVRQDGCVLIVQRARDPGKGLWGLPGGLVELGETLAQALQREVREECGISVVPGEVIGIIEPRVRDDEGRLRYHYVVVDLLATASGGELQPASDVLDARWVHTEDLESYRFSTAQTLPMIRKGLANMGGGGPSARGSESSSAVPARQEAGTGRGEGGAKST